jgi:hypothetical protein
VHWAEFALGPDAQGAWPTRKAVVRTQCEVRGGAVRRVSGARRRSARRTGEARSSGRGVRAVGTRRRPDSALTRVAGAARGGHTAAARDG